VGMLEGEDLGECFLTKFKRKARSRYLKPASVYEVFDESKRSERCVRK
jgi:transcriptional regulator NrdR family protein